MIMLSAIFLKVILVFGAWKAVAAILEYLALMFV